MRKAGWIILGAVLLLLSVLLTVEAARRRRPPTRRPTKRVATLRPTVPPTLPPTSVPTLPSNANGCPADPCINPAHCRSEFGNCGGNALSGVPDAWCNERSTWKLAGCSLSPGSTQSPVSLPVATKSPSTTRSPTVTPAPVSGVTAAPVTTTKSPSTKSPSATSAPVSGATAAPVTTTKSPTQATSSPATNAPVTTKSPTLATSSPVTNAPISSGGSCSGQPCAVTTQCRSEWGYCGGNVNGPSDDYCNARSTWKSTGCGGTKSPTDAPGSTRAPSTRGPTPVPGEAVADVIRSKASAITSELLVSQTPSNGWIASTVYKVADLETAVRQATSGFAGMSLIASGAEGKLNLAAFLSQAMKESIAYDVCDENNWDLVNGRYPASNACGQLGQSYQDYTCSAQDKAMECPLDPTMEAVAKTNAKWYGAPAPLYAGPKSKTGQLTPAWDYSAPCTGGACTVYPGQQAGAWVAGPAANRAGRTDVENCVWWGRGAIQLTGRCNIGQFNYYLGKAAADRGVINPPYPDVDFCRDPSAICHSTKYTDIKFVASFFYWMRALQEYNVGGWNYRAQLAALAADHTNQVKRKAFSDAVSGIVNRGSHTITADGRDERAQNFEDAYSILFS